MRYLPTALSAINHVAAGDPRFGWRYFPQMSARLFGFDAPLAYNGFQILSKPNQVKVHIEGGLEISYPVVEGEPTPALQTAMQLTSAPDPTDPTPTPANAPRPAPPVSSSLGEIIARLNARAAEGSKGDGLKVTVEPYLAPKRATVFGAEAITPRQEVDALADVYGLRVFTEEKEEGKDRLRLTRQTAPVPLNPIGLHASILQSLPDPLVRAYRMHPFTTLASAPHNLLDVPPLRVYAVKQIRTEAEPKLRATKDRDGRVALSALSEQDGRAFAMILMLDAMDALSNWVQVDPPDTIMRFNEVRLGGGLYEKDGKKQMDLLLLLPDRNNPTVLEPGPGVGEINYDPVNQTL